MEPKIIKGHLYKCKENVGKSYTKGRVYMCEHEVPGNNDSDSIYACGFITNNQGNTGHAWPYQPDKHPWTKDDAARNRWSTIFDDLGEKPHGIILCPYEVGDCVKWYCDDDGKTHTSKITAISIEIGANGVPQFTYETRIKFKGIMQLAAFTPTEIKQAEK